MSREPRGGTEERELSAENDLGSYTNHQVAVVPQRHPSLMEEEPERWADTWLVLWSSDEDEDIA